jgi:hypothetical protein
MGEIIKAYKDLVDKPEDRSGRPRCRWRIILKCILKKQGGRMWTGLISLMIDLQVMRYQNMCDLQLN